MGGPGNTDCNACNTADGAVLPLGAKELSISSDGQVWKGFTEKVPLSLVWKKVCKVKVGCGGMWVQGLTALFCIAGATEDFSSKKMM